MNVKRSLLSAPLSPYDDTDRTESSGPVSIVLVVLLTLFMALLVYVNPFERLETVILNILGFYESKPFSVPQVYLIIVLCGILLGIVLPRI